MKLLFPVRTVTLVSLCLSVALAVQADRPSARAAAPGRPAADKNAAGEAADLLNKELEEQERQLKADPLSKLVVLGTGVHQVRLDKKGRVQTCVCVGTARISTVLGASKGKEIARQQAALRARGAFAQWLKESIEIRQKSSGETTFFLEGSESNDKDALAESGKAVEKMEENIKSVAVAQVQGFIMIGVDVNAEDKELTIVYGWSAAKALAANQIAEGAHLKPEPKKTTSAGSKDRPSASADKKKIKGERVISDDAEEFLGKP